MKRVAVLLLTLVMACCSSSGSSNNKSNTKSVAGDAEVTLIARAEAPLPPNPVPLGTIGARVTCVQSSTFPPTPDGRIPVVASYQSELENPDVFFISGVFWGVLGTVNLCEVGEVYKFILVPTATDPGGNLDIINLSCDGSGTMDPQTALHWSYFTTKLPLDGQSLGINGTSDGCIPGSVWTLTIEPE